MRVMVTGAAGFIGSHLCRALSARGIDVVGLDCFLDDSYDASIKRRAAAALYSSFGIDVMECDIRADLPSAAWDGIDTVVNLAAMPGLMKSWQDFDLYSNCNVGGVNRLLLQARSRGISHFVQVSTSSVYGSTATGGEGDPLNPISPYGVTKLAGERLVAAYGATFGLPYSILRYFSVYGPGQRPDMAFHIFAERILSGEPIVVYGDGRQSRSNTYVGDVVDATVSCVLGSGLMRPVNIAGGEVIELLDAIALLEEMLGSRAILEFQPARPGDQRHTNGDTTLARELLAYQPVTTVGEGLLAQAEWHLHMRRSA